MYAIRDQLASDLPSDPLLHRFLVSEIDFCPMWLYRARLTSGMQL